MVDILPAGQGGLQGVADVHSSMSAHLVQSLSKPVMGLKVRIEVCLCYVSGKMYYKCKTIVMDRY